MATGPHGSCPICQETLKNITYVMGCRHRFCLGCIVCWVKKNPSCPLCRQPVHALICSLQPEEEFPEMIPLLSSSPSTTGHQNEQGAAESMSIAHAADFPAKTWALLFQSSAEILETIELWPNKVLLATCWWDVALAEGMITSYLFNYRVDEDLLIWVQPMLWEQMVAFVHELVAVEQCCERIQLLIDQYSSYEAEEQSHASFGPGDAPEGMAATNASTQEEPREELEQVVEDNSNVGQSSL